jgi:hypothetical protein
VRRLGLGFICLAGCFGTDAVGVSECRELEQTRCAAAVPCGFPDVGECRRYYRDHCLHGVALEAINAAQVDACVLDLERVGRCAADQGPDTPPSMCAEPVATVGVAGSVCDVVRRPEAAAACAFLTFVPAPVTPAPTPAPLVPAVGDAGGS